MSQAQLPSISDLTDRQRQVFDLLAKGLSNPEIAATLEIGVATVKTHVTRIFELLDVSTRAEAAGLYGGALSSSSPDGDDRIPGFGLCPAIAVMPFENISAPDPRSPLCQGLVEDLVQRLSWWRLFPILSRSSTWSYAGQNWDVRSVGRELGVAYCVEGSVQQGHDRYQITVNLVETRSGNIIWSDRYESATEDLILLQSEISQSIATALYPNLVQAEVVRHDSLDTQDLDAWQASLRGLASVERMQSTLGSNRDAFELFEHALSLDPNFALPHYGKVLGYNQRLINAWEPNIPETVHGLIAASEAAYRIDPGDPRSICAHGIGLSIQGDTSGAAGQLGAAVSGNPSDLTSLRFLALTLGMNKMDQEAATLYASRAVRLARRSPVRAVYLSTLATTYLAARRHEDAVEAVDEAVRLAPYSYACVMMQALTYAIVYPGVEAKGPIDRMRLLRPEVPGAMVRTFLLSIAGPLIEEAEPGLNRVDWAG